MALTKKEELEIILKFIHDNFEPDADGYICGYSIPEDVMKEYIRKYAIERGWCDDYKWNWRKFRFDSFRSKDYTPEDIINEFFGE